MKKIRNTRILKLMLRKAAMIKAAKSMGKVASENVLLKHFGMCNVLLF